MAAQKIYKSLLWVQGIYSLITALWPLLDIESFMKITGYKTDIWLVKTVSVVLLGMGLCLLVQNFVPSYPLPVLVLAVTNSIGLACIDFYYFFHGVIAWVYALDGVLELIFVLGWIYVWARIKSIRDKPKT